MSKSNIWSNWVFWITFGIAVGAIAVEKLSAQEPECGAECLECVAEKWPATLPNEAGIPGNVAEATEIAERELADAIVDAQENLASYIEKSAERRELCLAWPGCTPGKDITEQMRQQGLDHVEFKREYGQRQIDSEWEWARKAWAQCSD